MGSAQRTVVDLPKFPQRVFGPSLVCSSRSDLDQDISGLRIPQWCDRDSIVGRTDFLVDFSQQLRKGLSIGLLGKNGFKLWLGSSVGLRCLNSEVITVWIDLAVL